MTDRDYGYTVDVVPFEGNDPGDLLLRLVRPSGEVVEQFVCSPLQAVAAARALVIAACGKADSTDPDDAIYTATMELFVILRSWASG